MGKDKGQQIGKKQMPQDTNQDADSITSLFPPFPPSVGSTATGQPVQLPGSFVPVTPSLVAQKIRAMPPAEKKQISALFSSEKRSYLCLENSDWSSAKAVSDFRFYPQHGVLLFSISAYIMLITQYSVSADTGVPQIQDDSVISEINIGVPKFSLEDESENFIFGIISFLLALSRERLLLDAEVRIIWTSDKVRLVCCTGLRNNINTIIEKIKELISKSLVASISSRVMELQQVAVLPAVASSSAASAPAATPAQDPSQSAKKRRVDETASSGQAALDVASQPPQIGVLAAISRARFLGALASVATLAGVEEGAGDECVAVNTAASSI